MSTETKATAEARAKVKMWIFGHPFRLMVEEDFIGFAGADEGDLIAFPNKDLVLIYSPASGEMREVWDGDERLWTLFK